MWVYQQLSTPESQRCHVMCLGYSLFSYIPTWTASPNSLRKRLCLFPVLWQQKQSNEKNLLADALNIFKLCNLGTVIRSRDGSLESVETTPRFLRKGAWKGAEFVVAMDFFQDPPPKNASNRFPRKSPSNRGIRKNLHLWSQKNCWPQLQQFIPCWGSSKIRGFRRKKRTW